MNYAQAIQELESLGVMPSRQPSLVPIRDALHRAGLFERLNPRRNIVIAGTNGKGTTAATLSALLHSAGHRVGLYTSPHLVTTRERIRVAETDVSEEEFAATYAHLKPIILSSGLSHFEALTLMAAEVFSAQGTEWNVWEVGLGGLWDATNAIPHDFCGIAALGLDHQDLLGPTLEDIAVQKFGIVGPGNRVVSQPLRKELEPLRVRTCARTHCDWSEAPPLSRWGKPLLNLAGKRAEKNTALALALFEALGFQPEAHLHALSRVRWPGRFSRVNIPGFPCPVYASGDHNLQGVLSVTEILSSMSWGTLHLLVGIGRDKDAQGILSALTSLPNHRIYLTETPFKPLPLARYPESFKNRAVLLEPDPLVALRGIRDFAQPGDVVLVTGSIYVVGRVLGAFS